MTEEVATKVFAGYTPMKSVHVTNFMSINKGSIEFDESGIIKILGYNNSGKSAMLRALAVVFLQRWSTKQKQFIQDNKRYFQIDVCFADGVIIRYEKHASGTSLYEMYGNDGEELLFTTKISEGNYQKITGVPEQIATYLGILSTPDGINLAYGINTDKQLLVETSGSENYQALNVVLKSEELSRAVSLLNTENNQESGRINQTESRVLGINEELYKLGSATEPLLSGVQAYDAQVKSQEASVQNIVSAWNAAQAVASVPEIPEVPTLDTVKIENIDHIASGVNQIMGIPDIPEISGIDTGRVSALEAVNDVATSLMGIADIPELPEFNLGGERLEAVNQVLSGIETLNGLDKEFAQLEKAKQEVDAALAECVQELRAEGHVLTQCPGCGEIHLADVGDHG